MSTMGVMNKNSGQDTRIFGLHDNLFRRRIDLKREEGNEVFSYPSGPGSGTRNAMVWHPEPVDLQYAGRRHFPDYTRHKRLGYQDKTNMVSRDGTPQLEHRVSHRYDHLKRSSVFPHDDIKQKRSPTNTRNGIGLASPGDKSYKAPEYAPGYFNKVEGSVESRAISSAPPTLSVPEGTIKWRNRHTLQDIQDVQNTDTWTPATPLEPLTIVD